MKIVITGGAGFIGSEVVRLFVDSPGVEVVNVDKLTYAGNLDSLKSVSDKPGYSFEQVDITDRDGISRVLSAAKPQAIIHLAAESHVDRSIDGPAEFIHTNIQGTYNMLECSRQYWNTLGPANKEAFRFIHVSTDEVFGSLGAQGLFSETSPYAPNSPYAASKASADHLARAWFHTYGFPSIITNCSNNYGPYHFPEKLIPLTILNGLEGKDLPVYGKGENVRDWLYVADHALALKTVLEKGAPGETYNIGGNQERQNIEVVQGICTLLDELSPHPDIPDRKKLIRFVEDRPGHDLRYAIDASKIKKDLAWEPAETFTTGLKKTIRWYLDNKWWWERVRNGSYRGERLGLGQ